MSPHLATFNLHIRHYGESIKTAAEYVLSTKLSTYFRIAARAGHAFGAEAVMDPVSRASGPFLPLFILKRKIDLTSDG